MPCLNDQALQDALDDQYPGLLNWGPGTSSHPEYFADLYVAYVSMAHELGSRGVVNLGNIVVVRGSPEFLVRSNWPLYNAACQYAPSEGPGGCSHELACACVATQAPDCYIVADNLSFTTREELVVMAQRALYDDFLIAAHPRYRVGFGRVAGLTVSQVDPHNERWSGPIEEVRPDLSWMRAGGFDAGGWAVSWTKLGVATSHRDIWVFTRHLGQVPRFAAVPEWAASTRVVTAFQTIQVLARGPTTLVEVVSPGSGLLAWASYTIGRWCGRPLRWALVPQEVVAKAQLVMTGAPRTQGTLGNLVLVLKNQLETMKFPSDLAPETIRATISLVFPAMGADLDMLSFVDRSAFQSVRGTVNSRLTLTPSDSQSVWWAAGFGVFVALAYWRRGRMAARRQAVDEAWAQVRRQWLLCWLRARRFGRRLCTDVSRVLDLQRRCALLEPWQVYLRSLVAPAPMALGFDWRQWWRVLKRGFWKMLYRRRSTMGQIGAKLCDYVRVRWIVAYRALVYPAWHYLVRTHWSSALDTPLIADIFVGLCIYTPLVEEALKRIAVRAGVPPFVASGVNAVLDTHPPVQTLVNWVKHHCCLLLPYPLGVMLHSWNNYQVLASMGIDWRLSALIAAVVAVVAWFRRPKRPPDPPVVGHPFFNARASTDSGTNLVRRVEAKPIADVVTKEGSSIDLSRARPANPNLHLRPTMACGPRTPSVPPAVFASSVNNEVQAIRSRVQQELIDAVERTHTRTWSRWARDAFTWPTNVRRCSFEDWNATFPPARRAQHVRAWELLKAALASSKIGSPEFNRLLRPRIKAFVKAEAAALKDSAVPRLIQAWDFPGQTAAGPFVRPYCQRLREDLFTSGLDAPFFWAAGVSASAEDIGNWYAERLTLLTGPHGLTLRQMQICFSREVDGDSRELPDDAWFHIASFLVGDRQVQVALSSLGAKGTINSVFQYDIDPGPFKASDIRELFSWYAETQIEILCGDASRYDSTCDEEDNDFKKWLMQKGGGGPLVEWAYSNYPHAPRTTANGVRYETPYDLLSGEPGTSMHATVCLGTKIQWALERQGVVTRGAPRARQAFQIQNGDDHNIPTRRGLVDPTRLSRDLRRVGVSVDYVAKHPSQAKFLSRRLYLVESEDSADVAELVLGPLPGRQLPKMLHTPRPLSDQQRRRYVFDVCVGIRKAWSCIPMFDDYLKTLEQQCGDPAKLRLVARPRGLWVEGEYGIRSRKYHRPFSPETQFAAIYGAHASVLFSDLLEAVEKDGLDADLPPAAVDFFVLHDQPVVPML